MLTVPDSTCPQALCRRLAAVTAALAAAAVHAQTTVPQYEPGAAWGTVQVAPLREASGLAAGWRNPSILWTHNDGDRRQLYAVTPDGRHAATFLLPESVEDVEEIAVGSGPVAGESCLYVGDLGAKSSPDDQRPAVKIMRVAEPSVAATGGGSPPQITLNAVDAFTLRYPDGSFDAEAMFVDPHTADVYIITKTAPSARLYVTNLNAVSSRSTITLTFAGTLPVTEPSAAAISRDGRLIIVRTEDSASLWARAPGESATTAMARSPVAVPVIGTPLEPNGEAVTFTSGDNSYITLSEGSAPVIYHFQARTPAAPALQSPLTSQALYEGATLDLAAVVTGYPAPSFAWKRNGIVLAGQTGSVLRLAGITAAQAGEYELTAANPLGSIATKATVTVRPRPDVRITEIQTDPAGAGGSDWWELTSFEPRPVDLSGWRFNDDSGDLSNAFTLPAGLVIAPGESLVFVDELTAAQFRAWWGAAVPAGVRIVTYDGSGLALGPAGDTLRLWDSVTTRVEDTLLRVTTGQATEGVTFSYQPDAGTLGGLSIAGVNGAMKSAGGTDTGSPGSWLPPAVAPQTAVKMNGGTLHLTFSGERHRWYALESSADMQTDPWTVLGPAIQATAHGPLGFTAPMTGDRRFFRVKVR